MAKKLLRLKEVMARLGISHSMLYERFIQTGRLKLVRLGPRECCGPDSDLDALISELAEASN